VGSWSFVELRGLFVEEHGESREGQAVGSKVDFFRTGIQKDGDGKEGDCSICFDDFCTGLKVTVIRAYGHAFHHICLATWLRGNNTCPLCRQLLFAKERPKTLWDELDENAYFVPQLGDVRMLPWRDGLIERLVGERVRVMRERGGVVEEVVDEARERGEGHGKRRDGEESISGVEV
jgi:hypothetical protein